MNAVENNKQRLDIWLWAARAYKTRALAKAAIDGGKVLVNEQACKAAKMLAVGDVVSFQRGVERFVYQVLALSLQRGSAQLASTLYLETEASKAARVQQAELMKLDRMRYQAPPGKPDKRARQAILALQDSEQTNE